MALTRVLRGISLHLDPTGAVVESVKVTFDESWPEDADNPGRPSPVESRAYAIDPADLTAGNRTSLANVKTFLEGKVNLDEPLNTG